MNMPTANRVLKMIQNLSVWILSVDGTGKSSTDSIGQLVLQLRRRVRLSSSIQLQNLKKQTIIQISWMRKVNYHQVSFWEERYKQSICEWYEWIATPNQVVPLVKDKIEEGGKVLELGCGSSNFAEKLTTMGNEVTCLDFSKEIIKNRSKNNSNDKISYKHHNITEKLPFQDGQFDTIIDKNTLDCLFCQQNFLPSVFRCMKQCYRVLKNNGKMISITHGKEKNRKFFYRNRFSPFQVEVIPLPKKSNQPQTLIFVLTKSSEENGEIREQDQENISQQNNLENQQQNNENEQEPAEEQAEKQVGNEENQQKQAQNQQQPLNQQQSAQKEDTQKQEQQQQYQFDGVDNDDQANQ